MPLPCSQSLNAKWDHSRLLQLIYVFKILHKLKPGGTEPHLKPSFPILTSFRLKTTCTHTLEALKTLPSTETRPCLASLGYKTSGSGCFDYRVKINTQCLTQLVGFTTLQVPEAPSGPGALSVVTVMAQAPPPGTSHPHCACGQLRGQMS